MEIKTHEINSIKMAEVVAGEIVITDAITGLELMVDLYYQGFDGIIINEKNITPEFFDLKTRIAGELLQKFSNYRVRLVIVGDFEKYHSNSLKDFIFESNKGRLTNFVSSIANLSTLQF